ncbi:MULTISPECIES: hypothetical protein [Streptosporangium]|uniref:Uncharacterized protein n=1 Tax=Streptosporangium brasiliense TaxID=47480 RepID=A0ABT9QZN7_9ACTN|nr:hypothetical protein [Streptosporangium brasiliense]MDP9862418.1 hypothetical protein [Streptosporangium brasiliense]
MPCTAAGPHAFLRATGDRPGHPPAPWVHGDDQLLILLVTTWALATGRVPPNRPADQLSEAELIAFWADEQTATGHPPVPPQE